MCLGYTHLHPHTCVFWEFLFLGKHNTDSKEKIHITVAIRWSQIIDIASLFKHRHSSTSINSTHYILMPLVMAVDEYFI